MSTTNINYSDGVSKLSEAVAAVLGKKEKYYKKYRRLLRKQGRIQDLNLQICQRTNYSNNIIGIDSFNFSSDSILNENENINISSCHTNYLPSCSLSFEDYFLEEEWDWLSTLSKEELEELLINEFDEFNYYKKVYQDIKQFFNAVINEYLNFFRKITCYIFNDIPVVRALFKTINLHNSRTKEFVFIPSKNDFKTNFIKKYEQNRYNISAKTFS